MSPEPTDFSLDVANYLKNQNNSQNHPWKKGTTLIIGDSILSRLKEFKMFTRKTIKVRTFPGVTIGDIKFFVVLHLRRIVLRVGTNDAPHATPKEMLNAIKRPEILHTKVRP